MGLEKLISEATRRMGSGMVPIVKQKALEVVTDAYNEGICVLITDGFRTVYQQNLLYAKGRTTAQLRDKGISGIAGNPGADIVTKAYGKQSNHTDGIAIDFCLTNEDATVAIYNVNAQWKRVVAIAKGKGFAWGGDWPTFKDNPHLEYTGKITVVPDNTQVGSVVVTNPSTGSNGIKSFQGWLNQFNVVARFDKLDEDGYTGPKTRTAYIKTYQHFVSLTADGIFGRDSKAKAPILEQGETSERWIRFIQGVLYCRGYDPNGFDGIWGKGMMAALKKFQSDNGLKADGVVGPLTFEKLFA